MVYQDLTRRNADHGRLGALVNCAQCGEGYLLYYGQALAEQEARDLLERQLTVSCPAHKGWIGMDEDPPVSAEEHVQRVENEIVRLERLAVNEDALAQATTGTERERLILSSAQKRGDVLNLRQELC